MALAESIESYDKRHGWRGPLNNLLGLSAVELADISEKQQNIGDHTSVCKSMYEVFNNIINNDNENLWINHFIRHWGLFNKYFRHRYHVPKRMQVAYVTSVRKDSANICVEGTKDAQVQLIDLKWAKKFIDANHRGGIPTDINEVLQFGDVIVVKPRSGVIGENGPNVNSGNSGPHVNSSMPVQSSENASEKVFEEAYELEQVPEINGAMMVMNPHTGAILAMVGGYDFNYSKFNRATQALRQPGSAFKPIVYAAALEYGLTPVTIIKDTQLIVSQGPNMPVWKPSNYIKGRHAGDVTLRTALESSNNIATVKIAQFVGMGNITDFSKRLGIYGDNINADKNTGNLYISSALGSEVTTLLRMVNAYATMVNGGYLTRPHLINYIQNNRGKNVFINNKVARCIGCDVDLLKIKNTGSIAIDDISLPQVIEYKKRVIDEVVSYQMLSMLEGVVNSGTGRRVKIPGNFIAGKTGTTNDNKDTWFIGFTDDLVIGVYLGFDQPKHMGIRELGGNAAAPAFKNFLSKVLYGGYKSVRPRHPVGIIELPIDKNTGKQRQPQDSGRAFYEVFKIGTEKRYNEVYLEPLQSEVNEFEILEKSFELTEDFE